MHSTLTVPFRAEKHITLYMSACTSSGCVPGSQFEKKWWEFCHSGKQKKLQTKRALSIFPVSSNILSLMWWDVLVENQFFWTKSALRRLPGADPGNSERGG